MLLSELLSELDRATIVTPGNPAVAGISYDSRTIERGQLFVAVPGFQVDGHSFINEAVAKSAAAVVAEKEPLEGTGPLDIPYIVVPDSRAALAALAARFHGHPARQLRVFGVTGTDGKTTTVRLINAGLEEAGRVTGWINTVDFKVGERRWDNTSRQTTPEAPEVQALLREMVEAGVQEAVIEATSHALALHRVSHCDFDVAVVTNVTGEHLDFHLTWERYLRDKGRLVESLARSWDKGYPKAAVLNADDRSFEYLRSLGASRIVSFGFTPAAEVAAEECIESAVGLRLRVRCPGGRTEVVSPLVGRFNAYNLLAAFAALYSQGLGPEMIARGLGRVAAIPGRMERIECGQPFSVIVDYAHTPSGLEEVLRLLRPLTAGKLIAVFGCAGERDRSKRPLMGRIAAELADFFVLANEDPRFEDPEAILEEIAAGAEEAGVREGEGYLRIADRREAIRAAFGCAGPGDLVLLAGKGHEGCIIVGDQRLPWDDRAVARELLAERS